MCEKWVSGLPCSSTQSSVPEVIRIAILSGCLPFSLHLLALQISRSLLRDMEIVSSIWGICGSFPLHRDRRLGEGRTAGGRRVREARSRMPGRALSGLSVGYLIPPTDWHPRGQVLSAVGSTVIALNSGRPVEHYKRRGGLLAIIISGGPFRLWSRHLDGEANACRAYSSTEERGGSRSSSRPQRPQIVKVTNTAPLLLVRLQRRRRRDSPCGGGGGGGAVWAFVVICYGACVADPL